MNVRSLIEARLCHRARARSQTVILKINYPLAKKIFAAIIFLDCFAKSHLLAALLRANGIPTGFCYQRLSVRDDGEPYSLHGYNAVYLPEVGWYRIDARGNRQDIDAQFVPPQEKLAYAIRLVGEVNFQNIFAEPLPIVVEALQS